MLSVNIQLGARVRRRTDIGMDEPGVVVRLKDDVSMVLWPQDNFYQVVPVSDLEPYGSIQASIAA